MITVYSKAGCPQCDMAVRLLTAQGVQHEVKKLGDDYQLEDLKAKTNAREFPVVFEGDTEIGGFKELRSHLIKARQQ